MNKRRQLTLFVDTEASKEIEFIREKFNSEQFNLIKSHVTLCREDEIEQLDLILANLKQLDFNSFSIEFDIPIRFNERKGVYLPTKNFPEQFHKLRKKILSGIIENPRIPEAHITLMHPRNSTCNDAIFEEIKNIPFPTKLMFSRISLIEQEIGEEWKIIKEFDLI